MNFLKDDYIEMNVYRLTNNSESFWAIELNYAISNQRLRNI